MIVAYHCRSTAEFQQDIEQIRTFIVYIPHNENFYCDTTAEATESLLEHCSESEIPTPTRIDYVINGYYMLWEFKRGLTRKEFPVWKFMQKKLHRTFKDIGADVKIAQDATAMIYAPDFVNSDAVGFDLSDTIQTVYYGEAYPSPYDIVFSLPLSVSEIEEYRKTRAKIIKSAPKEEALRIETDETARKKLFSAFIVASFKMACVEGDCYRFRRIRQTMKRSARPETKPRGEILRLAESKQP